MCGKTARTVRRGEGPGIQPVLPTPISAVGSRPSRHGRGMISAERCLVIVLECGPESIDGNAILYGDRQLMTCPYTKPQPSRWLLSLSASSGAPFLFRRKKRKGGKKTAALRRRAVPRESTVSCYASLQALGTCPARQGGLPPAKTCGWTHEELGSLPVSAP